MKKVLLIIALLMALPVLLTGCATGQPPETRQYEYAGFTNVQIGNAFQVEITPSSVYNVSVTAPPALFKYIRVEKLENTLKVGIVWSGAFWNNWFINARPKVNIAMPELGILDLSGATEAVARGFSSNQDFKLMLSGASRAQVGIECYNASLSISGASKVNGQLKGHDVRLNLSGASTAELNGNVNNLNLQASGASKADLKTFTARDVRADLSGASQAKVSPSGKLDIFLSGASRLEYAGDPTIGMVDVSGASTLSKL